MHQNLFGSGVNSHSTRKSCAVAGVSHPQYVHISKRGCVVPGPSHLQNEDIVFSTRRSRVWSMRRGIAVLAESHLQFQERACSIRSVTSPFCGVTLLVLHTLSSCCTPLEILVLHILNHTYNTKRRFVVPEASHLQNEEIVFSTRRSSVCRMRSGYAVPRESHLQYQQRVCSSRSVTSVVREEGV